MKVILISVDDLYSKRLVDLINKNSLLPCKIQNSNFSDMENINLKDYILVLVDFELLHSGLVDIKELDKDKTLFLAEEKYIEDKLEEINKDKIIYKYQSYRDIQVKILEKLSSLENVELISTITMSRIISIYSPINRIGKSLFCEHLAKLLSREYKTLYISFDLYISTEKAKSVISFSEFLYTYIKSNFNILTLKKFIDIEDNLHIIKSFADISDLFALGEGEYLKLLKTIAESSAYDYIIIDLGQLSLYLGQVVELSYKFIIPYIEESFEKAKLEKFKFMMKDELTKDETKLSYLKLNEKMKSEESIKKFIKEDLGVSV